MTYILAEDVAHCPPQAAAQRLQQYFAGFERSGDGVRYEIAAPFEGLNLPPQAHFSHEVALSLGEPKQRNNDTLLPLRWTPADTNLLPSFEGYIELTPLSSDELQLAVIGEYEPPMGFIGDAFDALMGRHIADATLSHLVTTFKRAIEAKSK